MQNLHITYINIDTLKPYPNNPREHSDKQLHQIGRSINKYGFIVPPLVDENNTVVIGQARIDAAKKIGIKEVPVICITHLTPAQVREFRIADNKLSELSEWNIEALKNEFKGLLEFDSTLDLTITGFEIAEIDTIILGESPEADAADDTDGLFKPEPVSQLGDLWLFGNKHRLLCGDALKPEDYVRLMDGSLAQVVFSDPPYNLYVKNIGGLGKVQHDEFSMASGEMNEGEFTGFLTTVLRRMASFSEDGSIHFVCMDWRHVGELSAAGRAVFSEHKNICVWTKDNGGMGSLYRSQHELIFVYKNGTAPHINNIQLGQHGRYRTNVWHYPGQNTFHAGREEDLAAHPTVKPVQLVADAILDCSKRDGIVLDAFGGSGTTILAAEKTGRRARLLELEPQYVDVAIRRWQKLTGQDAVHADSGKTFNQISAEKQNDQQ